MQLNVNVVVEVTAGLWALPLTARAPLQPPDAVQESALLDDQLNVVIPPLDTLAGLAESVTVGGLCGDPGDAGAASEPPEPPPQAVTNRVATLAHARRTPFFVS